MVKSNVECIRAFREAVADDIASLESAAAGLEHVIGQGEGKPGAHDVALEHITKVTDMIGVCVDVDMRTLIRPNLNRYLSTIQAADRQIPEKHLRTAGYVQHIAEQIQHFAPAA